jgi:hypothetical protein
MLMLGLYTAPPSSGGQLIFDASPFVLDGHMSTNVHGAEALDFRVLRDLAASFKLYNQTAVVYVGLFDGTALLWEGRLEDPALSAHASGSGFSARALGYWRALTDVP